MYGAYINCKLTVGSDLCVVFASIRQVRIRTSLSFFSASLRLPLRRDADLFILIVSAKFFYRAGRLQDAIAYPVELSFLFCLAKDLPHFRCHFRLTVLPASRKHGQLAAAYPTT